MKQIAYLNVALAVGLALVAGPAAKAGLLGDTITINWTLPVPTGATEIRLVADPGAELFDGDGSTFDPNLFAGESINFSDTTLSLIFTASLQFDMTVTGIDMNLLDVVASSETNATISNVMFDASSFSFTYVGNTGENSGGLTFRFEQGPPVGEAPEPGSMILLLSGVAGLAWMRRRRSA